MKFPCRCRVCRGRRSLRMHPDSYQDNRSPSCMSCGTTEKQLRTRYGTQPPRHLMGVNPLWRVDLHRLKKEKQTTCSEDCLPHPHRWGCKGCKYRTEKVLEGGTGFQSEECPF